MQQGGHDTARRPYDTAPRHSQQGQDTAGPRARACGSPHARVVWLARELRYKCCIVAGGDFWVAIQRVTRSTTRQHARCDTARGRSCIATLFSVPQRGGGGAGALRHVRPKRCDMAR